MKNLGKIIAVGCITASCTFSASAKKQPNVLFIMSDDHTTQGIGAYGSRLAKLNPTPTIDRLAHEGVMFENAFCTNSICTPSRACIMSGQYSQTNGVLDLNGHLAPENQYLAKEMKSLGYQTAVVGNGISRKRPEAFDYYNVLYGQGAYFNPVLVEKGMTEETMVKAHWKKRKMVA